MDLSFFLLYKSIIVSTPDLVRIFMNHLILFLKQYIVPAVLMCFPIVLSLLRKKSNYSDLIIFTAVCLFYNMAAVKRLPVYHHSADYVFGPWR